MNCIPVLTASRSIAQAPGLTRGKTARPILAKTPR